MDVTRISVEIFNKRANEYQELFMDVSAYHPSFNVFLRALPSAHSKVLELGCGPGNITRYLLSQSPLLQILGTDLAPRMIELAEKNNPGATFELLDARDLGKLQSSFDGILCGFCLPYLSKEESLALISQASERLNQGGILYLSTMEDDYARSGPVTSSYGDEGFYYYHQADYLLSGLQEHSFQLLDEIRVVTVKKDGTQVVDLCLIARKNG